MTESISSSVVLNFARERISTNQLYVLLCPGHSLSYYAGVLDISTAAMTGQADSMEKRGLITRSKCPTGDRRVFLLSITDKGTQLVKECTDILL